LVLFSQQTIEWVDNIEKLKFPIHSELKPDNKLTEYLNYDFTDLLMPNSEFLGFIGEDFRRIQVIFEKIQRSDQTKNLYFISGSTTVFNNKCDFEGTIVIDQVREFKKMHFGIDNIYQDSGLIAQGLIIGKYHFNENPLQNHVGIFDGIMTLWWYLDKNNKLHFDNLSYYSDNYRNNQYIGTWTEYGSKNGKSCNWGEQRIPFSGDLDIGAGGFSVNPKYRNNGWEKYIIE